MSVIRELSVVLTAVTGGFTRGMKQSAAQLEAMKTVQAEAAGTFRALGAVVPAAGKSVANLAGEIARATGVAGPLNAAVGAVRTKLVAMKASFAASLTRTEEWGRGLIQAAARTTGAASLLGRLRHAVSAVGHQVKESAVGQALKRSFAPVGSAVHAVMNRFGKLREAARNYMGAQKKLEHANASCRRSFAATVTKLLALSTAIEAAQAAFNAFSGLVSVANRMLGAFSSVADKMEKIHHQAERIGASTKWLSGFSYAAGQMGVSQEQAGTAVDHMQMALGRLAAQGVTTGLSLRQFGLSAKRLSQESPQKAMQAVAGAFHRIHNGAERAALATTLFGRSGMAMTNVLMQGNQELQKQIKFAERTGIAFDSIQANKVIAAKEAMTRLWAVGRGFMQTVVVQLAPYLEAAVNAITRLTTHGVNFGRLASQAVGWVIRAVSYLADAWQVVKTAFYAVGAAINGVIGENLWELKKFVDIVIWVGQQLHVVSSQTAAAVKRDMLAMQQGFAQQAAADGRAAIREWQQPWAHTRAEKFLQDIRIQANVAAVAMAKAGKSAASGFTHGFLRGAMQVTRTIAALKARVNAFGQGTEGLAIAKLRGEGASTSQLAEVRSLYASLERKKGHQSLLAAGKRITEQNRTPLEKYRQQLAKLNELLKAGAISATTFGRAGAAAMRAYHRAAAAATHAAKHAKHAAPRDAHHQLQADVVTSMQQLPGFTKGAADLASRQREKIHNVLGQILATARSDLLAIGEI